MEPRECRNATGFDGVLRLQSRKSFEDDKVRHLLQLEREDAKTRVQAAEGEAAVLRTRVVELEEELKDETASQIRLQLRDLQDQLEEKEKEQASQDAADPERPSPRPFKKPFPKSSSLALMVPAPAPSRKKGPIGASAAFNPVRIVLKKNATAARLIASGCGIVVGDN